MTEEIEVSDFVMMSDITEETMMDLLKERFNKDKIYVNYTSFYYIISYFIIFFSYIIFYHNIILLYKTNHIYNVLYN